MKGIDGSLLNVPVPHSINETIVALCDKAEKDCALAIKAYI